MNKDTQGMLDKYKLIMESNFKKIVSGKLLSGDEYDDIIRMIQSGESDEDIASKSKLSSSSITSLKRNIRDRDDFLGGEKAGVYTRDHIKGVSRNKILAVVELNLHKLFFENFSKPESSYIGTPGVVLCNTTPYPGSVSQEDIDQFMDIGFGGWTILPFNSDDLNNWNI